MGYTITQQHELTKGSVEASKIKLTGWVQIIVQDGGDVVYTSDEIKLAEAGVDVPKNGTSVALIAPQVDKKDANGRDYSWSVNAKYVTPPEGNSYVDVEDVVTYDGSQANESFKLDLGFR